MASSKRSLILDNHPLMTKTIMSNARGASRVVEDFTERVVEARRQNILIHHFHHHHRHRHHHIIVVILLFLILINFRQLAAYARERARKTKTRYNMIKEPGHL